MRRLALRAPLVLALAAAGLASACAAPPTYDPALAGVEAAPSDQPEVGLDIDPRQLLLQPADLGPGFRLEASGDVLSQMAGRPGFVAGRQAMFERSGLAAVRGAARVQSWALVFRSSEGAQAWLDRGEPIQTRGLPVKLLSVPQIGHAARALELEESVRGAAFLPNLPWTTRVISGRVHNVAFVVLTTGLSLTADFEETQAYARVMANRISEAAGGRRSEETRG